MNCPVCANTALLMSERNGVEIDYCPKCRGVWLDRGELDKIIERSTSQSTPQQPHQQNYNQQANYHHNNGYKYKKKESWLGELFDF
ncbi:zf-TFIIB domain-containing protein [Campylobacter sp. IFREMER_LSEM_CL2256]|uniref:TFIIB-type zinc ribbon-containing protein n=1 Tax=unclassified Campylobacter TaxID=2593542 RepID=UPI0021E8547E|nr:MULTISPECIES: zf-TFIIB domain-containing protein [unclassified Campylobacter]MCV3337367.1 zf-TFIIB domain-containing protein [Campylobacter sp. RKI_CA19_01121]MCV3387845.1 zf-TFIIB domain-containing protein [Campylobacter sp. IFREMER_LSEM_CL2256]